MIIEVEATDARFHDIQPGNIWKESLDYGSRLVSLNGHQAHLDADNKWRYVLAHSDPGVANWLDITGHEKGTVFMRFLILRCGRFFVVLTPCFDLLKLRNHFRDFRAGLPRFG